MEIKNVFRTTLEVIDEFKGQTSEITGAGQFLDEYISSLQFGLSRLDHLDTSEKLSLFQVAWDILEIIADENEKATFLPGSILKVAIVRSLQRDIRVAIKGLDE